MVPLVQRLRHWLADESVVYECRNCGTTVDAQRDGCPACGADDIARHEIE
jgi:rubrerythrin